MSDGYPMKEQCHLQKCFAPFIVSLVREAQELNNAEAAVLATFVNGATMYLLTDVLWLIYHMHFKSRTLISPC